MLLKSSKANAADAKPLVESLKSISRFEAQGCFKEKTPNNKFFKYETQVSTSPSQMERLQMEAVIRD